MVKKALSHGGKDVSIPILNGTLIGRVIRYFSLDLISRDLFVSWRLKKW